MIAESMAILLALSMPDKNARMVEGIRTIIVSVTIELVRRALVN
jgi:hypothetical protein